MVVKIPGTPYLPQLPLGAQASPLSLWGGILLQSLTSALTEIAFRANHTLPSDGTERMEAPLPLQEVLTADRPTPAASNAGTMLWVTDAPAGDEMQVSNGTGWYPVVFGPVIP